MKYTNQKALTRAERRLKGFVKIALAVDEVATIEQALRATEIDNRGHALIHVCHFFLEHYATATMAERSSAF